MEPYFVLKPVIALLWYVRGIPKKFLEELVKATGERYKMK